MQVPEHPVEKDIVLVGGGHSHVRVLKRFGMRPEPGIRLTLICRDTHTPYSGMLPGYVAGHYSYDDVHIDLSRLAEFAGARFYRTEALGIDRESRTVQCRDRPPVPYDFLSINTGATPRTDDVPGAVDHAIPVKPIHRFNQRWQGLLARTPRRAGRSRIAVVGGGAGGVELLLAMQFRLGNELQERGMDRRALEFHLLTAGEDIMPSHPPRVRRRFRQVLEQRGVVLHCDASVTRVEPGHLHTAGGLQLDADEIVWVTSAGGAPWLRRTGLQLDDAGFIQVGDTLQSLSDPRIFAAGDTASMINHPREKAGVFAVRQGKALAENLRRVALDQPPSRYRPQRQWLALISTGDRHAVASRGRIGFHGDWVWRWKDRIDRAFMRSFSEFPPMAPNGRTPASSGPAAFAEMRCGGCGAKVESETLSRVLRVLRPIQRDDVALGLQAPDDAAVTRVPADRAAVQTVDFFRAFIHDPFVFGKITANHALGDIDAMGAEPQSALAIATVPYGPPEKTEDTLLQMMAGAVEILNEADCALIGGHSGEAAELALGFAITGLIAADGRGLMRKSGSRAGDLLLLTKPLGTGTLLAAHAQLRAKGRWIDAALASMSQSSRLASQCLRQYGAHACTDVTGFGLAGHLLELLRQSKLCAELELDALPTLEGAAETAAAGSLSSLHPANARFSEQISGIGPGHDHPNLPLLFDPQTAGGLLASVPARNAHACLQALQAMGYRTASIIGRLRPARSGRPLIALTGG
ncbi:MAG: selenide, water dikinase SelD [Ectothiorhodospiraceae bacterium]|nr:selenide, water dikinase SelD [Ectothiorhodospiraceae bacterium]